MSAPKTVVDLDDDSASMMDGIARTLRPGSTLVLMTDNPDKACIAESRRYAARILHVDFDQPDTVVAHRFWRQLNRLYLLSADPSTNLLRLSVINQRLAHITTKRRIRLIVRIDDPWLRHGEPNSSDTMATAPITCGPPTRFPNMRRPLANGVPRWPTASRSGGKSPRPSLPER